MASMRAHNRWLKTPFLILLLATACSREGRSSEDLEVVSQQPATGDEGTRPLEPANRPFGSDTTYVGLRYTRLPSNVEYLSGSAIDELNGTAYSVSLIRAHDEWMLWLNRVMNEDRQEPERLVVAVLDVSIPKPGEALVLADCRRNGERDSELVALVVEEDEEWYRRMVKVWRANREAGRFDVIPADGVECENEGYGA